jgi:hypothetical protein
MLRMLSDAIKGVYASVYFRDSKAYMQATSNVIDQEKMAVILQEVVGNQYGDRYYPSMSGVARSLNYYPLGDEKAEEGKESTEQTTEKTEEGKKDKAEASADEIKDLVIARLATREIESFNILYSQTFSDFENLTNLTDPLLEVDTHGKLVACLADEWGTEDNGLNWKFHIRDGVKWVDMNANEKADVTSYDFATGMEWVLNFHKNDSSHTSQPIELIAALMIPILFHLSLPLYCNGSSLLFCCSSTHVHLFTGGFIISHPVTAFNFYILLFWNKFLTKCRKSEQILLQNDYCNS